MSEQLCENCERPLSEHGWGEYFRYCPEPYNGFDDDSVFCAPSARSALNHGGGDVA